MPKLQGQRDTSTTALGGWKAGTRPTTLIRSLFKPEACLCAWDMHGEQGEDGIYIGLYWFTLKYRYRDCPSKRNGEHG